jgi:spore maturation protein CgeB
MTEAPKMSAPGGGLSIVLAGDWAAGVIDEPMAKALESLGHSVTRFAWRRYFESGTSRGLTARVQNRFLVGPRFRTLNEDLVDLCRRTNPDLLLVRRGTHVTRATLEAVRAATQSVLIVGTCNDDPFAPTQGRLGWRHFLRSVPEYDLVLASRHHNLNDLARIGARRTELLRFWFVPERHRPISLTDDERARYASDVVFVGHYEADKRIEYLNALVQSGVSLKVFGPDYPRALRAPCLERSLPVRALQGDEYTKALCGAEVALCLFSTLNRDSHTFRSFEIPASGTMMLCEYTADMASMFDEGIDVEFFRSKEELVSKAKALLADPERRRRIAAAGRRRVVADGHDVVSRMRQVLGWVSEIRAARPLPEEGPC